MSLARYKTQFFRHPQIVHLNNAGLAPIPLVARTTVEYWAKRFFEEGFYTDHDYMQAVAQARGALASLIGCQSAELAFFTSTAGAINQVAFHLDLAPGDEVLMWDQEYSSHLYPWQQACMRTGAKLVLLESDKASMATPTQKFLETMTSQTRVVAFSWMQFQSGAMMDFVEVIRAAKKQNVFVFVDVMQGLGILPDELWQLGVDAVGGGSHKWLTSPVGVGFLALRAQHIAKMRPHTYGAATFGTCDDPSDLQCSPKRDASKFEPGSKQVLEITALGSALELILQTRVEVLFTEALRLKSQLIGVLDELGFAYLQPNLELKREVPILNIRPPHGQSVEKLSQQLNAASILHAQRGGGIRLSLHAFNEDQDVERVRTCLAKYLHT